MSHYESSSEELEQRFSALLSRYKEINGWTNTWMAQVIWGDDNRRGHISGYLKGTRRRPSDRTIELFCTKLGIPDVERHALYMGLSPSWPAILDPDISLERTVIGRDEDLAILHSLLAESQAVAILPGAQPNAVVRASGGMGKSALARYYAVNHANLYYGVWWLDAANRRNLTQDLINLGVALGLTNPEQPDQAAQNTILHLQKETNPWLLIYDNAEKSGDLRGLVPRQGPFHLLYTSRNSGWGKMREMPLDVLEDNAGMQLLLREADRFDDQVGALELVRLLGALPLALICAGAWLRDIPSASFADYTERYEELLRDKPVTVEDYPNSVFGAVKMSLMKLSDNAQLLMNIFAYLAPEDLWPGLFTSLVKKKLTDQSREIYNCIPNSLMTLAKDPFEVERAFSELGRRSLLTPGKSEFSWRIHRLTQAVQRGILKSDSLTKKTEDWPAVAAAVVAANYPSASSVITAFPTCIRLNPHVTALESFGEGAPATRAMEYLYSHAGTYYWAMRQDRLALSYAIAMIRTMRQRGVPEDHILMATGWNKLAARLSNAKRPIWAVHASERAVAIADANPNMPDDEYTVCVSANGTFLYYLAIHRDGDAELFDRSRARLHEALRLGRKKHGRHSREVGNRLNNLGAVHDSRGRLGAAALLWRTALSVRRKVLLHNDVDIGQTCNNLGALLLRRGQITEARSLLLEALEIKEAAFSANPKHPSTLKAAEDFIQACLLDGAQREAKAVAERLNLDLKKLITKTAEIRKS